MKSHLKWAVAGLILGVTAAMTLPSIAQEPSPSDETPSDRTVTTTGVAIVRSAPDEALVTLGVHTDAETADEAMDQNAARISDVIRALLGPIARSPLGARIVTRLAELVTGKQLEQPEEEAAAYGRDVVVRWMSGSPNASVLPEPVLALPQMSRPARASAMVIAWMGKGVWMPSSSSVSTISGTRPSSWNEGVSVASATVVSTATGAWLACGAGRFNVSDK